MLISIDEETWEHIASTNASPLYEKLLIQAKELLTGDLNKAIDKLMWKYINYQRGLRKQFKKYVQMHGPITDQDIIYGTITEPGTNETFIHGVINYYILYSDVLYYMFRSMFYECLKLDTTYLLPYEALVVISNAKLPLENPILIKNNWQYFKAWEVFNEDAMHYTILTHSY
jgi:hypothetical protein